MLNLVRLSLVTVAVLAIIWSGAQAGGEKGHDPKKDHVIVRPDDIKWIPAPPSLPPGATVALLSGNPFKAEHFVIRAKMPDGYKVPPHWHPTDENVTVIQGTLMVGKGDKFDANASQAMPAGSFMRMPKDMRHFAWAKGETIIQVHGVGPFEVYYVNAEDDPRKK